MQQGWNRRPMDVYRLKIEGGPAGRCDQERWVFQLRVARSPADRLIASCIQKPASERLRLLSAIVQGGSLAFSASLRLRNLDQLMIRRERADWISRAGIPGDKKSLAATTAKVSKAALTVLAGSRHPFFPPELLKSIRTSPNPSQRMFPNVVKVKSGYDAGGVAGQCTAGRVDQEDTLAPSAHAGLRISRVVVGDHRIDPHLSFQTLPGLLYRTQAFLELVTGGKQRVPILERPPVILGVRDLHSLGLKLFGEFDHLVDVVQILSVDHQIDGECYWQCADGSCQGNFVSVRFCASYPVCQPVLRVLEAQLNMVETSLHKF